MSEERVVERDKYIRRLDDKRYIKETRSDTRLKCLKG